jgi:hypothetical protein
VLYNLSRYDYSKDKTKDPDTIKEKSKMIKDLLKIFLVSLTLSTQAQTKKKVTIAIVGEETIGGNIHILEKSTRNYKGHIESLIQQILQKINFKKSNEQNWSQLLAQHLDVPTPQIATTANEDSSIKDLARQFDDLLSLSELPEYVFVLLSHKDLCALHPSMIANTNDLKELFKRSLSYFIRNAKPTKNIKVFVGGYLGVTQFYNQDILEMEHTTAEGKNKSCNKIRNTAPSIMVEEKQDSREQTLERLQTINHPARVCPTIFSPKTIATSNLGFFEKIFSPPGKQKRKNLVSSHMTAIATKSRAIKKALEQSTAELKTLAKAKNIELIFVQETSEINWKEKDKQDCFANFSQTGHRQIAQAFIKNI